MWIYSSETLPNPEFFGKPGYTPEWLMWNGITLPVLDKGTWKKVSDNFYRLSRTDWRDKEGRRVHVSGEEIGDYVTKRWGERGVTVLDHEPTAAEKELLEAQSRAANLTFRMHIIEDYEDRLKQKAVGEKVPTKVTPYENECYEVLGLTKPYSVEAMRAQRHPGESVGEQIVAALEKLDARRDRERAEREAKVPPPNPVEPAPKERYAGR